MPRTFATSLTLATLALGVLLCTSGAQASGGHDNPRPTSKSGKVVTAKAEEEPIEENSHATPPPAAAPAPTPAPAARAGAGAKPIVTMDDLRQRLQDKMGQVKPAPQPPAQGAAAPEAVPGATHGAPPAAVGSAQDLILRVSVPPAAAAPRGKGTRTAPTPRKPAHTDEHTASHWGYAGEGAPAAWGSLKPEFATCANGSRQSPIDIRGGIRVDLEPIQFDYRPVSFQVVDNGHTVQANLSPGNSMVVSGKRYELLQFHFHRPSEESINGRRFEMVAHLVHKDAEGRLAVIAVLMDQGKAHPMVQLVWNSLPLEQSETVQSPVPIDMNLMLPEDRRYFTYMGSLTTPPCSEGVRWLVLKQPATLSPDQAAVFARLYPMNARPVQQTAGRLIKESN